MSEAEGSSNPKTAYEHKDAPPALIAGLMALVAAVVIAAGLILTGIYPGSLHERSEAPTGPPPPQPRLEINEAAALHRFEAGVAKRLDSYGWIDRRNGIVHIPIAVAMRRAAKAGFPDWPGNPKGAAKQAARNGSLDRPGGPK